MNDSTLSDAAGEHVAAAAGENPSVIRGENFVTRNLKRLRRTWQRIAGVASSSETSRGGLTRRRLNELEAQMHACVAQAGGEVSARLQAAALGETYLGLDPTGRHEFLELLAGFGPDRRVLAAAAGGFLAAHDDASRLEHERAIREAVRAPRVKILTQFTGLPDGVKFLVDLRADLLEAAEERPHLDVLERELSRLLALWFDVGFLELQRITWDSPASLLERLIAYEAVHEIRSWDDLRNRLDSDRRCYAFFHPRMPREPLIFVEVALSKGLSDSIQSLLDENQPAADPRKADTAIFYSISSTQRGLRGISFGNFLIKRVVDELKRDFQTLRDFATLSPVPGFVQWLQSDAAASAVPSTSARARLKRLGIEASHAHELWTALKGRDWSADGKLASGLEEPLVGACAYYLAEARQGLRPIDPVARFHLDNGARIERLNWLADTSPKGLKQSAGIMVNYVYDPAEIESNHEAYRLYGKVALSSDIRRLLRR